jgi:predicted ester cyclase
MLSRADCEGRAQHAGLHETRQRMPMIRAAFPDLRFEILIDIAKGNYVALRRSAQDTHLGPFMGAATTVRW